MAEVADLVGEDRADLVLVQTLEEALRHDELRGPDRPAEDERVRGGIGALPDDRRPYAGLTGELRDRLIEPRVRLRGDCPAVADRPADDRGRDEPLEEDEEQREPDDDREGTGERVRLEGVVRSREDDQQQDREEREDEEDRQDAAPAERVEGTHAKGYYAPPHEHCAGMPELVESISCPKCGGPLNLTTGEIIVTCPYCGTASRIEGDKPFVLRHSMLAARHERASQRERPTGLLLEDPRPPLRRFPDAGLQDSPRPEGALLHGRHGT